MGDVRSDNGHGRGPAIAPGHLDVFTKGDNDAVEGEDFHDPNDWISAASNAEGDGGNSPELLLRTPRTPAWKYFDAFEEVPNEASPQSSWTYVESELHEVKLNLLMEIGKRKQVEEGLISLHTIWQRMTNCLSFAGLMLPPPTSIITIDKNNALLDADPVENFGQHLLISKLVMESISRGFSSAEVLLEMEPLINSKIFEITRLQDRLEYFEAANREMSQKNQQAVDVTRQRRNKRKRRQKWIWRLLGISISLGAAAFIFSYLPPSDTSSGNGENEGIIAPD